MSWGPHGSFRNQDLTVLDWINAHGITPVALDLTKDDHPFHPLTVAYVTKLIPVGRKA